VTTDFERWKSNKGELDFPGVDTPTESPDVRPKDLKQEQRPNTTEPTEDKRAVERQSVNAAAPGQGILLESEAEASATDSDVIGAFVSGRAESRDVSVSRGEALRGERTDSIVSFAGPTRKPTEGRVVETDRRKREANKTTPEEAFGGSKPFAAAAFEDEFEDDPRDRVDGAPDTPTATLVESFNQGDIGLREMGDELNDLYADGGDR